MIFSKVFLELHGQGQVLKLVIFKGNARDLKGRTISDKHAMPLVFFHLNVLGF